MPTEKGSVVEKILTDYSEDTGKIVRRLGENLVPPMKEVEFTFLSNEIQKLYENPSKLQDEDYYKELSHMQQKANAALTDFNTLYELTVNKKSKESSLILASMFLFTFEGVYINTLDTFCSQLVINGHDLFDLIRREYALSPSEISDVDIATKFKFLEGHNLKMLIRREDQKLRNRIAHYDFSLDKDGNFSIDGKVVGIDSKLLNLTSFLVCVNFVTGQALRTILKKREAKMTLPKNQLKTST